LKSFLVLVLLSAAGLAGVLYWRRSLEASRAPVAAAQPTKHAKERRHRTKRGARRLARNEVFVASQSPSQSPPDEAAPGEAPPPAEGPGPPPGKYRPPPGEDSSPVAGGASTTEAAGADPFAGVSASASQAQAGSRRQPVVAEAEPEPVKLRPGDTKMVWQGEDLSRAENQKLDFSKSEIGHELSQDEIDSRFRTKEDAVLGCVSRARPDEYTLIPGRVNVRFRIMRTGAVKGVQVEAPAILQRGGLTGCVNRVVSGLRFPASDSNQVITFPFTLM
jgi:hypothetical protein